jgi:predicted transcriptional regulator
MKSAIVLAVLVGFALVNTVFLGVYLYSASVEGGSSSGAALQYTVASTVTETATSTGSAPNSLGQNTSAPVNSDLTNGNVSFGATATTSPSPQSPFILQTLAQFFEARSLVLAPTSWFFVGGMWIWRGRMKSKWTDLGFDSDVFGLFVRMKGAKTRIRLLDALSVPKDRLQLAQELGLDWKAVDRHIEILDKYGFVHEKVAYGKVRMFELTSNGKLLLQLLEELNRQPDSQPAPGVPLAVSGDVRAGI